jgi:hypothetical protein
MGASYTVMLLHCNVCGPVIYRPTLNTPRIDCAQCLADAWTRPCLSFSSSFSHWVQMTAFEMYADLYKTATSACSDQL